MRVESAAPAPRLPALFLVVLDALDDLRVAEADALLLPVVTAGVAVPLTPVVDAAAEEELTDVERAVLLCCAATRPRSMSTTARKLLSLGAIMLGGLYTSAAFRGKAAEAFTSVHVLRLAQVQPAAVQLTSLSVECIDKRSWSVVDELPSKPDGVDGNASGLIYVNALPSDSYMYM